MSKTIFQALQDDHDSQRALLEEIARTRSDPEEWQALLHDLKCEMRSHAHAERKALLAHLLDDPSTRALAERAIAEHAGLAHAVNALVEELETIGFARSAHPELLGDLAHLRARIERQLEDEEHALFHAASKVLSPAQGFLFAAHYQREKRAALRSQGVAPLPPKGPP